MLPGVDLEQLILAVGLVGLFLIVFAESGLFFGFFLPGDSLLLTAGVNWVKFPVWYNDQDLQRANQIARFAERLNKHNINMVAVIDKPPEDIRSLFGEQETLLVANVFAL